MIGKVISHYQILDKLGEGGMGAVYRARDTNLDRLVAIKVLPPEKLADPDRKRRFIQEAKAASALNHPNIITIHDIQSTNDVSFIAMEYVKGKTLRQMIPPNGLALKDALRYAAQIADALATVHSSGIIHRDLKPGNVMVTESELVKVLDFGLAKLTERGGGEEVSTRTLAEQTADGLVVGTAPYMSPEQIEGRPVDGRSDIFSFGAMLYEMLTGRRPFHGGSAPATMTSILHEEPEPPAHLNAAVPPELERVVLCCLEKDPARRFQNAADVKVLLEWLERDAQAGRLGAAKPVPRLRSRKRKAALTLAVVLAGVAIAAVAYWARPALRATQTPAEVARVTSDPGLTGSPALSARGDLLAYASDRSGDGNLDIWVQQLAGGGLFRRTHDPTDELSPRFSPDGSRIVFERVGSGIFVTPALSGSETLIARDGHDPRFSPDGTRIAYWTGDVAVTASAGAVFVTRLDRGNREQLSSKFVDARFPLWAPDGRHVLFQGARSVGDEPDWWVVPVDGGPAVNTGVLAELRKRELTPLPGPGDWEESHIVFSGSSAGGMHIWRVTLKIPGWHLAGPAEQLTFGTGVEGEPSIGPDGRIAFASWHYLNNLWKLRLHDGEPSRANLERISETGAPDTHPSISADGKTLAFLSRRSGNRQVWIQDLEGRGESELTIGPGDKSAPVISANGSRVAYSVTDNNQPSIYTVPMTSSQPGVANRACENCGVPSDWTHDGSKILYLSGRPQCVYLLDLASGARAPILSHPAYDLDQPRLSPDGHWIALVAAIGPDRARIFISPFRNNAAVAPSDWIAVTEGEAWDDKPRWLGSDQLIYYSNRDRFGCIWKKRLQADTKHPIGPASPVYHFHTLRLSPRSLYRSDFEIAVARNTLILNLVELTGNIWLTALPQRR